MLTTLRRCAGFLTRTRGAFGDQAKAALPPYLSAADIKEKLPAEEYAKLEEKLGQQEKDVLAHHHNRLAALEKQLTPAQKDRIGKIEALLATLNEQEADYIRFRLLELAEGKHHA